MDDDLDRVALALARECPRRIGAILHCAGHYVHYELPCRSVCCFDADSVVPEQARLTAAQEAFYRALRHPAGG